METNNEHEVMINKVELASDLAHKDVCALYNDNVYINSTKDSRYKTHIQPIFNDIYDTYYEMIEACEIKKEVNNENT